jgi:hypothetical protein
MYEQKTFAVKMLSMVAIFASSNPEGEHHLLLHFLCRTKQKRNNWHTVIVDRDFRVSRNPATAVIDTFVEGIDDIRISNRGLMRSEIDRASATQSCADSTKFPLTKPYAETGNVTRASEPTSRLFLKQLAGASRS